MKIWAVANQKGGVGKTTTTVSLAGILASRGEKTLVVDLDPHGSLTSYLNVDPETVANSIYDLYQDAEAGRALNVNSAVHETAFENLSLLPASTAIATLEKQLGSKGGMGLVLSQALNQLTDRYAYVIIDCPPMLGMLMVSALAACDELIIPVQTEHLAIKGLQRMVRTLSMIERSLKASVAYTILPTMFDQRTMASKQSLHRIQNDFDKHLSTSVIPVDTKFRDASHMGKPISYVSRSARGLQAYEEFLSCLTGDVVNTSRVVAQ